MSKHSTDIIVVGGGIIGMLTARELALAGARVTLLERHTCGQESSWAGGGIVSPLYPWRYGEAVSALARWGQQHYPALSAALLAESGIDPEWTRSGLLMLDVGEETGTALAWAQQHDYTMESLDIDALHREETALALGDSGLWMPQIAQVRNPRLSRAAREALPGLGIALREQTEVRDLLVKEGRIQGVETERGPVLAERVVVAGGAWSAQLLRALELGIEVEPVKGQMILYRAEPGAIQHIVLNQGKYLIPRRDGHVLAGSTLEYVGYDKGTTEQALAELRQVAETMFPFLSATPVVKQWAGLRPGSPAGVPFITEHPDVRGLFINAGHFRNGVVLGPASARLLADLLLERSPIVDPAPYAVGAPRS